MSCLVISKVLNCQFTFLENVFLKDTLIHSCLNLAVLS